MYFLSKFISRIAVRIEFARSYMRQHYMFTDFPDDLNWKVDRQSDSRALPDRKHQSSTQAE